MALPVILVNSATGSDSAASGAGPAAAVTGTAAAHTGGSASTTVTLTNSPTLSGVATDGSAVLFLNIATAGVKNFSKITAVDNSAKTVTVADSFTIASGSAVDYAIGGVRAGIGSTASKKLFDNNGAAGDLQPGWAVEFQSGHAGAAIAGPLDLRANGDATTGPITIRGASGAAVRPVVTFSNNGNGFVTRGTGAVWTLQGFDVQNSNATKTASVAVATAVPTTLIDMGVKDATNNFWKGVTGTGATSVRGTEVANCASNGIDTTGALEVIGCEVHNNGGHGIVPAGASPWAVMYSLVYGNAGDGINTTMTGGSVIAFNHVFANTIHGNAGDGIDFNVAANVRLADMLVANNNLTGNGGYGINFSGSGWTTPYLAANQFQFFNNNHYGNTSGLSNLSGFDAGTVSLDPTYSNAAAGDFTPTNAALAGAAFPTAF